MANEWKWAQTTWSQSTDTSQDLMDLLQTFMEACGWELASYGTVDERFFIRADHGSRDIWHYTGEAEIQRCGIVIKDFRYNGGAFNGTNRLTVKCFLENLLGTGAQVISQDTFGVCTIDFHATKEHLITLIGGEDAFEYEFGVDGANANVALGIILTHAVWPEMNGTRDPERKYTTQGLPLDLFGSLYPRHALQFDIRMARNDGANLNASISLVVNQTRTNTDITVADQGIVNNRRMALINWDIFLGREVYNVFTPYYTSGFGPMYHAMTFGLLTTPFDDRWRLSPLVHVQGISGRIGTGTYDTSPSVSTPPSVSYGGNWLDARNLFRKVPRVFVVSHLLAPWQNITDEVTSKVYRVLRVADGGRTVCLAIEWPGSLNEVTL